MNAIEILGLACVDAKFRRKLFENVESVIGDNKVDLTWAEESGLRRITRNPMRVRKDGKPHTTEALALLTSPESDGAEAPNDLEKELKDVGDVIMSMWCPEVPCAWPSAFIQNKPDKTDK
jgi:hypothetical protein